MVTTCLPCPCGGLAWPNLTIGWSPHSKLQGKAPKEGNTWFSWSNDPMLHSYVELKKEVLNSYRPKLYMFCFCREKCAIWSKHAYVIFELSLVCYYNILRKMRPILISEISEFWIVLLFFSSKSPFSIKHSHIQSPCCAVIFSCDCLLRLTKFKDFSCLVSTVGPCTRLGLSHQSIQAWLPLKCPNARATKSAA